MNVGERGDLQAVQSNVREQINTLKHTALAYMPIVSHISARIYCYLTLRRPSRYIVDVSIESGVIKCDFITFVAKATFLTALT